MKGTVCRKTPLLCLWSFVSIVACFLSACIVDNVALIVFLRTYVHMSVPVAPCNTAPHLETQIYKWRFFLVGRPRRNDLFPNPKCLHAGGVRGFRGRRQVNTSQTQISPFLVVGPLRSKVPPCEMLVCVDARCTHVAL